jgi:excisionase family DNA binding protein
LPGLLSGPEKIVAPVAEPQRHVGALLPYEEVASRLKVSEKTVRRLVEAGELERVRIGSSVRITPESVVAYRQRLRDSAREDN